MEALLASPAGGAVDAGANTTIGVVATDLPLTVEQAQYVARVSHDGLALAIRPCHTMADGDTMFALASGAGDGPAPPSSARDMVELGAGAVEVVAASVLRAVRAARGLGGVPSVGELARA